MWINTLVAFFAATWNPSRIVSTFTSFTTKSINFAYSYCRWPNVSGTDLRRKVFVLIEPNSSAIEIGLGNNKTHTNAIHLPAKNHIVCYAFIDQIPFEANRAGILNAVPKICYLFLYIMSSICLMLVKIKCLDDLEALFWNLSECPNFH